MPTNNMPHPKEATGQEPGPFQPGPVLLLGSGETSPTARKMYDRLFQTVRPPLRLAVLETPAGFEPNSDRVAGRVADFFRQRLPHYQPAVSVVPARKRDTDFSPDDPRIAAPIWTADAIFAGAGSPTYAVRQLRGSLTWQSTLARHLQGATLIFASAAALAVSRYTLPVYEIFKVGEDLHWKQGLDLFGPYGLELAIVTHWNNREGGEALDTSHGFMGRERFARLQEMLPSTATTLGIDEHTGALIDLQAGECQVQGAGGVTLLRGDERQRLEAPARFPLTLLGGPRRQPEPSALAIEPAVWKHIDDARRQIERAPQPPPEVLQLLDERNAARQRADWDAADVIRGQIEQLGWQVEDTPQGPCLQPIEAGNRPPGPD